MIEEDLFEQEIQKKKRRVLILLVCLFVLAGGGFIAQRDSLVEETGEGGTAPVTAIASLPTPAETPEAGESKLPAEDNLQTPTVEGEFSGQAGEETVAVADGVGGPIVEPPSERVTEEEVESSGASVTPVAGDAENGTEVGGDKSAVDDKDSGESQAGGEIGTDRDSGDEITADDAGTEVDEETTADAVGTVDSDAGADGIESGREDSDSSDAGVSPADELADEDQLESDVEGTATTGEANTEGQTVKQDSEQEQETDFQPPPGQLPVTGSTILNWSVAPVVAISVVILLVSAGVSSLFLPKRQRY